MFHISRQFIGQSVILKPQIPHSAPEFEDRKTRRICVSPTIEQCMIGIIGAELKDALKFVKNKDWYIYTTDSYDYIPAKDVFDHMDTEEHWFLEPTKFTLYGTVCSQSAQKGILKVNSLSNSISSNIPKNKDCLANSSKHNYDCELKRFEALQNEAITSFSEMFSKGTVVLAVGFEEKVIK